MAEIVIRAERLTRDFKSARAVDSLDLNVPKGIVFGFLGPNGSGKTTTIRMLLGIVAPSRGSASVLGFDVTREAHQIRSRCGALLEHPGIYERLSAEDNLEFYGRISRIPEGERRSRSKELLEAFGLWDRRKDGAGTWSRGMKQKLAIIRAMFDRPELVFLDEPTAGLDVIAATEVRETLTKIVRSEGVTVFLTTHNLSEAEKVCARVAVIRQGKLLAEGSPDQLRAHKGGRRFEIIGRRFDDRTLAILRARPQIRSASLEQGRLHVDLQEDATMPALLPAMVAGGIEIEEIRKQDASLEDVFLSLVEGEGR